MANEIGFTNVDSFKKSLHKFNKVIDEQPKKINALLALELLRQVVFLTPVDKGPLVQSWVVDFKRPSSTSPEIEPSEDAAQNEQALKAKVFEELKGVLGEWDRISPVYITTTIGYAVYVEFGTSNPRYPAARMVKRGILNATSAVTRLIREAS